MFLLMRQYVKILFSFELALVGLYHLVDVLKVLLKLEQGGVALLVVELLDLAAELLGQHVGADILVQVLVLRVGVDAILFGVDVYH